jgi:hypothetical protein
MLKVKYSKSKRVVILDFAGDIRSVDIPALAKRIFRATERIGHGYTLVEIFRNPTTIGVKVAGKLGSLIKLCYAGSRIWRVVKVLPKDSQDPGIGILHRTRWGRNVPEIDTDSIHLALEIAEEEMRENAEWCSYVDRAVSH